jgi:protein-S-isoprenylcysteine O-methyltransferase Ste14
MLRAAAATNLLLVAVFGLFAYVQARRAMDGNLTAVPFALEYALILGLVIVRRRPVTTDRRVWDWVFAAGAWVPLLMQPADTSRVQAFAGAALSVVGLCITLASLASLGRSFGIVAANRGLQTRGMYGLVRHPVYFGESLAIFGNLIANPTIANVAIVAIAITCLFPRMVAEERLMGESYKAYADRVRWRLVPGVFRRQQLPRSRRITVTCERSQRLLASQCTFPGTQLRRFRIKHV